MLHGGSARDGWRRLVRRHPDAALQLEVVPTYHTSSQAFIGPPETRAARMAALRAAFARTARILQDPDDGPPAPINVCAERGQPFSRQVQFDHA